MKHFFLGGDHLSTYFTFTALKRLADKRFGLIYLDAHPDLYDHYEGNPYSHACVVKRIIDETNIEPETIFQVGIRAPTPEQTELANSVGINTITTKDFQQNGAKATAENIKAKIPKYIEGMYLSIDMDILDPAYAPGVGNPEPAGLTTRELIDFIHGLQGIKLPEYRNMKIGDFARLNLQGSYIISCRGHLTCVVNGKVYDTWNCSYKAIGRVWKVN